MKFKELMNQNKNDFAIATLNIETGVDGGWNVNLSTIDTIENFIENMNGIKETDNALWFGILRDGEYLNFADLYKRLNFQIITKAEAKILNKFRAFEENHLCLDEY